MALARSRRLGIADLLGQKEVDLKKAAIFPQALLRSNDRYGRSANFLSCGRFLLCLVSVVPAKGRIKASGRRHPSTNIKTF
jgi:hypothetical protein